MSRSLIVILGAAVAVVISVKPLDAFASGKYAPAGELAELGLFGGAPSPNLPRGAQTMDQSAFAMGSMQWNVIFVEGDGSVQAAQESWTAAEITNLQTKISGAETYWEGLTSGFHPNAQLSINVNYVNGTTPMTTGYEPTTDRSEVWVNDIMNTLGYMSASRYTNVRNFNQATRVAANTHWATTVFAIDNTSVGLDSYAYAYFGGPFTILTHDPAGWTPANFNFVLAHEMGHILMALDEYAASGVRTTYCGGYLNIASGNASLDGGGNPVTPPQPNALMLNNGNFGTGVAYPPSVFSSGMFGHQDTDLDTIPDILDTFPTLAGDAAGSDPLTGEFDFTGSLTVNDITNANPLNVGFSNSRSDMTINTIASASYVLDSGSAIPFGALDSTYDDYTESLGFTIPGLGLGPHTIDVYGTNSVGNQSNWLSFNFTVVPEPGTLGVLVLVLTGIAAIRHRR